MAEYKDGENVVVLGGKELSLKKSVYPTVKALVAGLLAGGMTEDKIKALIPAESFDSDGQKALEVEKIIAEASAKLTPAIIAEAAGLLGNADVAEDAWEARKAEYDKAVEAWGETEDGRKLKTAEDAVTAAIAARDAIKTDVQASGNWKALSALETALSVESGKVESVKTELSALRRKAIGEDEKYSVLRFDLIDGKVALTASGRKPRAKVIRTPGENGTPGKGATLIATKDGQAQTFQSAAEALRKLDPAFVSSKGANFSRAAIITHLGKAGYTCS